MLALQRLLTNGDTIAVDLSNQSWQSVCQVIDAARRITGREIIIRAHLGIAIRSALNLFFGMTMLPPSSFFTTLGSKPGQVTLGHGAGAEGEGRGTMGHRLIGGW